MVRCIVALCVALASAASAQAPVVTPAGDPSVRNDTIYRLAAESSRFPDDPYVWLLDDGIVRIDDQGRVSATYRAVIHILKEDALEAWAEREHAYSPTRERFRVNWARVLSADGTVISDKPAHEQVQDFPVQTNDPVFTDRKVHIMTLGGVAPGTIVDVSVTTEDIEPILARDFLSPWGVTTGAPTRRSRLIVEAPASFPLRIFERNLTFQRQETTQNGRRVYTWATAEVPKPKPEPYAADSNNTVWQSIQISGPVTWTDIARWYANLARDRYEVTPAVRAKVAELVRGARTRDDSIRALHRYVSRDIRYVSLSLGIGGYQPRTPDEVLRTRFGDCKDKATLFITMARELGLQAHPVLVSSEGGVRRDAPSIFQFDHMIVAVEGSGGYVFSDMTSGYTPWGQLPIGLHREFGVIANADGTAEEVTLPGNRHATRVETVVAGTLSPDGRFEGTVTKTFGGPGHEDMRESFAREFTTDERQQMLRSLGGAVFEAGRADSLVLEADSLGAGQPLMRVRITGARAARINGNTAILTDAFGSPQLERAIESVAAHVPRKFWIDAESVFGYGTKVEEMRITLPEGWRAQLPNPVEARSQFGTYKAEFSQTGRELRVRREITGGEGVAPPQAVDQLLAFLRQITEDDGEYVVLTLPGGATGSR